MQWLLPLVSTRRQGRHIQVSAYVVNNLPYKLQYGLDVAAWAEEGLVDFIIPNPWHGDMDVDVASFVEVTRGTGCQVYPDILPRRMSAQEYRQQALDSYATGVDGLAFWDTNSRYPYLDEWSMIRRLGHEEELSEWAPDQWPAYRQIPLHSLDGQRMDSPPYWSAVVGAGGGVLGAPWCWMGLGRAVQTRHRLQYVTAPTPSVTPIVN